MTTRHLLVAAVATLTVAACGPSQKKPTKKVQPVVEKIEPPKPKTAAELFLDDCHAHLDTAKQLLATALGVEGERSIDNTLEPYNDLLIAAGQAAELSGLYAEVHPDEAIRDGARACEQEISAFITEMMRNRALYDAVAAVDVSAADPETQRFVDHTLRDFRMAGVDRDDATRNRLQAIDDELTKLSQAFSKNLAEDVRSIAIDDVAQLAGLPQDWIDAHKPGDDGKIHVSTDYPDYVPFMTYAEDDGLRKELYIAFRSRGENDTFHNEKLLQQILSLRAEKALLLDHANWADYITQDKMMKSGKNAADFIERVYKLAKKRAAKDYAELLKQLKKHDKKATVVQDWQKTWLEAEIKKDKYAVDGQKVRAYFPFDSVLAGLLDITSTIYDIQYVPATDATPWHPDVKVFDVMRGDTKLGRVYLDLHPRADKYKHAAQFAIKDGVTDKVLPEGALVCNFPQPGPDNPGLMEHDEVVTMFHEFGHLMHHILGGHHRWVTLSGTAVEQDFVEAPSQMFEEWAWSYETLSRFAKNAEGEVIPKDLVAQMRRADKFGLGTQTVQQMFYAALSLDFHTVDPEKLDQLAEVKRLQKSTRRSPTSRAPTSTPASATSSATRRCTTPTCGRW